MLKTEDFIRHGTLTVRLFCLIMVVTLTGCAGEQKARKDPFFGKWETLAETARGHSPTSATKKIRPEDIVSPDVKGMRPFSEITAEQKLPRTRISLKMRQADIRAVLRSLARTAGLNILVNNDVKGEITVEFREVSWDQAFRSILDNNGLGYVFEGEIIRVRTAGDIDQELKRKTQAIGAALLEPLLPPFVVRIDFADPKKLMDNLQDFLTKDKDGKARGSIKLDEHSNALIIQAIRDDLDKIMMVIEKIDKPIPQIQIRANIVETTKDTARSLGVQWGGRYNPQVGNHGLWVSPGTSSSATSSSTTSTADLLNVDGYGVNFPASAVTSSLGGTLGLMFGTIGGNILEMQLSALQTDGKLNILSSPSITTLDNQKAFTENGEKVPYVTTETSNGTTTNTVKFEDAVLRLEITPHVIDGRNLKMKIFVKKDEVDTSRNVDGNPFIIKKQTETTLIVQDGETIVISGLTKQTQAVSTDGVPGLKDISGLGWLFKNQDKSESMQEVLIFITPTILQPQAVAALSNTRAEEKSEDSSRNVEKYLRTRLLKE